MTVAAYNRKFKVYIEGVFIPFWSSIQVSTQPNVGSSCSITIPDDGFLRASFITGYRVAIFMRNDEYKYINQGKEGDFYLLYEGTIERFSYASGAGPGVITMHGEGWSYYCKQARYFMLDEDAGDSDGFNKLSDIFAIRMKPSKANLEQLRDAKTKGKDAEEAFNNAQDTRAFNAAFNCDSSSSDLNANNEGSFLNILKNVYYGFAYCESNSSKASEVYKAIFDSVKINKKVWGAKDDKSGTIFSFIPWEKAQTKGGAEAWWQIIFKQILSVYGSSEVGTFFTMLQYFLNASYYQMIENLAPSKKSGGQIVSTFFKPDVFYAIPPKCNFVFPMEIKRVSGGRNTGMEPNIGIVHINDSAIPSQGVINNSVVIDPFGAYINQQQLIDFRESQQFKGQVHSDFSKWPGSEYIKGVRPYIMDRTHLINVFLNIYKENLSKISKDKTTDELDKETKNQKDLYAFRQALFDYWNNFYSQRNFSANINFSPFLIAGHPCVVAEDYYCTIGNLEMLTHNITPASASTQIVLSKVRTSTYAKNNEFDVPDNFVNGFPDNYNTSKIDGVYSEFFGTNALSGGTSGTNDPKGIFKFTNEAALKLVDKYKDLKDHEKQDFVDSSRGRSFVSELEYFDSLGFGSSSGGIKQGQFPSVQRDAIGKGAGSVFIVDRQNTILAYRDNILERGYLRKQYGKDRERN